MGRIKTFTNGGSLLVGDLNSIEDDYEFAFSTYKTILAGQANIASPLSAGTFLIGGPVSGAAPATAIGATPVLPLDPAEFTANARTSKYVLKATLMTNATAPTVNFTAGLYPVTACAGGAAAVTVTLGTVVAGSTVAFATPGANLQLSGSSGDFTAPASGYYVLGFVNSGTLANQSESILTARLLVRQV